MGLIRQANDEVQAAARKANEVRARPLPCPLARPPAFPSAGSLPACSPARLPARLHSVGRLPACLPVCQPSCPPGRRPAGRPAVGSLHNPYCPHAASWPAPCMHALRHIHAPVHRGLLAGALASGSTHARLPLPATLEP